MKSVVPLLVNRKAYELKESKSTKDLKDNNKKEVAIDANTFKKITIHDLLENVERQ